MRTDFGINAIRSGQRKQVQPASIRGISPERVARAVLRAYLQGKREVVVPWYMHPMIKLYQLFPGVVEQGMMRRLMSRE